MSDDSNLVSQNSSCRQDSHSHTGRAISFDTELQKELKSKDLELIAEDKRDQALPKLEEPQTAQVLQTNHHHAGIGNIIVLNVGNTKNLATALRQIVSTNFSNEENMSEKPGAKTNILFDGNFHGTVAKRSQSTKKSSLCSNESSRTAGKYAMKHPQPKQPQSTAAFMLVPLPETPSSNIVSAEHTQSSISITLSDPLLETNSSLNSQNQRPFISSGLEAHSRAIQTIQKHATKTNLCGNPSSQTITDKTAVSSPGLAFLAQVSSLASNHKEVKGEVSSPQNLGVSLDFENSSKPSPESRITQPGSSVHCSSSRPNVANVATTTFGSRDRVDNIEELQTSAGTIPKAASKVTSGTNFQMNCTAQKRRNEMPFTVTKEKKKKGPAPKLSGDEVCRICGDRASGFHYNTLSCEGCKGFFRRSVIKDGKYHCKEKGVCTMDLYMRRKCQKCRFDKCKAAGMREESVLSEEKVRAKRMKKECDTRVTLTDAHGDAYYPKLTPQQRSLLELLKANERRFQWPTSEDVKKVTVWVEGDDTPRGRALRFAHFTELCILIVQLVVEFTKQLPGFLSVPREDQIVLLKACAIEVLLLRAAKQYNKHDGTINFLNGKLYDKSSFYKAGMQVEFVDPIFKFCNSMSQLDLDETEYAILVAINTFSTDRPHIRDTEKVECMQEPYVELLRVYSRIKHPDDPLMFARILMKIVELRTLNNYHSEQIFALKVQDRKLPPLLAEIWDM